jgi:transmembrane 9 superfamily protein 2/4
MKVPASCEVACGRKLTDADKAAFVRAIDDDYRVHWMVDNLPVGIVEKDSTSESTIFTRGFPVGMHRKEGRKVTHYVNNHVRIIIQYHDDVNEGTMGADEVTTKIVGFRVEPMSIKHQWEGGDAFVSGKTTLHTCSGIQAAQNSAANLMSVDKGSGNFIVFTYDVVWERSDTEWSNRWDSYLNASSPNDKVHYFSITNSMMIVLFLTVMIAMILLRTLRKDIAQYNDPSTVEEAKEESGWKLVHGDVFRPPATNPMLFR